MAMSPVEQINFSLRDAEDSMAVMEEMAKKERWDFVTINLSGAFTSFLHTALVACRTNDARAPQFLQKALDVAKRAENFLFGREDQREMRAAFAFEVANILALLNSAPVRCTGLVPLRINFVDVKPFSDRQLSLLLFEQLTELPPSADWHGTLSMLARKKRAKLAVETYSCYRRIIDAASRGKDDEAMTETRNAAKLFEMRSADPYFQGGPSTRGGGPSNDFVIDYELAAIQRRYLDAPAPGAELHWWRW